MKKILLLLMIFVGFSVFAKGNKEQPVLVEETEPQYVSPNGDGINDDVKLEFKITLYLRSISGFIPKYGVEILSDENGAVVKSISNAEKKDLVGAQAWGKPYESFTLSREIYWDAKTDKGEVVKDGKYLVKGWAFDANNHRAEEQIGVIYVDTVAPVANLKTTSGTIFSPNGDGFRDKITFEQEGTSEAQWTMKIVNKDGEDVRIEKIINGSLVDWTWDGTDSSGKIVPDGEYTYKLIGEDFAGNISETYIVKNVVVDTKNTSVKVDSKYIGFSPKGERKTLDLGLKYALTTDYKVWGWTLGEKKSNSSVIAVEETSKPLPEVITLTGKDSKGNYLKDGVYLFKFWVEYNNGDIVKCSKDVIIDNTPPQVSLDSIGNPFAKVKEGVKGDYFITVDARDNFDLDKWGLEIVSKDKTAIKSFNGSGNPSKVIAWNTVEKDEYFDDMLDNKFFIEIEVEDIAGNKTKFEKQVSLDILVIERDGKFYLMVPNVIFGKYKYELDSKGKDFFDKNKKSIEKVKKIYEKYPAYDIILEAHALNIFEKGTVRYDKEEEILFPLTENRASEVEKYLVELGFDKSKIKKDPKGSKFPLVDPNDNDNNWKNRRVEFIMEMKKKTDLLDLSKLKKPEVKPKTEPKPVTDSKTKPKADAKANLSIQLDKNDGNLF